MEIGENEIYPTDTGGDKPALLFVHGIMMDHSVWQHQLAEFAATHRVVCVDLRGFGTSSTTSPETTFEDHRDDLLAVVNGLGLRDVTLIGWSMGGAIAQIMAAQNKGQFKQFVLVDTPVDCHRELMGWIPPPDGIAMCQGDVGHITDRRKHPWNKLPLLG